jgi:hypothetical protein
LCSHRIAAEPRDAENPAERRQFWHRFAKLSSLVIRAESLIQVVRCCLFIETIPPLHVFSGLVALDAFSGLSAIRQVSRLRERRGLSPGCSYFQASRLG